MSIKVPQDRWGEIQESYCDFHKCHKIQKNSNSFIIRLLLDPDLDGRNYYVCPLCESENANNKELRRQLYKTTVTCNNCKNEVSLYFKKGEPRTLDREICSICDNLIKTEF